MSSPWIFEHLEKGYRSNSGNVADAGVIPTPAVALLHKRLGYAGGVMISASHNPYQDNGIKVFGPDGAKLTDPVKHSSKNESSGCSDLHGRQAAGSGAGSAR